MLKPKNPTPNVKSKPRPKVDILEERLDDYAVKLDKLNDRLSPSVGAIGAGSPGMAWTPGPTPPPESDLIKKARQVESMANEIAELVENIASFEKRLTELRTELQLARLSKERYERDFENMSREKVMINH